MASSIIRRTLKIFRGANSCKLGGRRMMTSIESPPWLMLSPHDDMAYKFYSLSENKIVRIEKIGGGGGDEESPDDDAEVVGSSHGWLTLFNRRNNDLFLSNPRSGRHIKLPRIDILSDLVMNLRNGRASVSKVILSSSPGEKGCRAMMAYGVGNSLAFCSPGRSWRWTCFDDNLYIRMLSETVAYEDMVYCKRQKVVSCMRPCELNLVSFKCYGCIVENWDLESPLMDDWNMGFPQLEDLEMHAGMPPMEGWNVTKLLHLKIKEDSPMSCSWVEENMRLLQEQCIQMPHLVYAEHLDRLYIVMRFVAMVGLDGRILERVPYCPARGLRGCYPSKTVGFVVLKVDHLGLIEVVDDLNGLAMFVGINHSSVFPASQFPQAMIKPNSIYFTGPTGIHMLDGRNDTGVFDYVNKTMSPIIIQGEGEGGDRRIGSSSHTWFTPTPTY